MTQAVDRLLVAWDGPAAVERPAGVPAHARLEWGEGVDVDDDWLPVQERYWTWKDADGKPHVEVVEEPEEEVAADHPVPTEPVAMCPSQIDLALAVAKHSAGRLAFVREERAWLAFWPGKGWETVHPGDLIERLMEFGRNNMAALVDGKWKLTPRAGGSRGTAEGVAAALSGVPGVATAAAEWDADMDVLGLPGGKMVRVSTGEIRNLTVSDRVRWRVSCFPATDAELQDSRFLAVVEHGIPNDQEREYVQRRMGAALSDTQGHDDLIAFVGPAACGKGTILEAIKEVFGSYAGVVPASEIQTGGRRSHSAWLAALRGRRLLCCDDMPQRDLDVSAVKQLLGSVVSAQHMRTAPTDFRLHAPLLATANHSPTIGAADSGLRRRLKPITCGASIPEDEQDPKVRASMSSPKEQAAALRWILDGAKKYRGGGAPVPRSILDSAEAIMDESPTSEFIAERWDFTLGGEARVSCKAVHDDFKAWMTSRGQHAGRPQLLNQALRDKGWKMVEIHGKRHWAGARARPAHVPLGGLGGLLPIDPHARAPRTGINIDKATQATLPPKSELPAALSAAWDEAVTFDQQAIDHLDSVRLDPDRYEEIRARVLPLVYDDLPADMKLWPVWAVYAALGIDLRES